MDNEEASSLSPHHRGTVGRVAARPGAHYHYYLGFVAFEGPAPLSLGLLFFFFWFTFSFIPNQAALKKTIYHYSLQNCLTWLKLW